MKIAIIGFGVVGGGVHALLEDGSLGITVKRIMDIAPPKGLEHLYTDNIGDIVGDSEIDCVVEAIGGTHPALSFVTSALRRGKHVVTPNKEMVSRSFGALHACAAENKVEFRFGASVGGGVPWLHNLLLAKQGDKILSLFGIANGTTNYILDEMTHGKDFAQALSEAQRLGYAEADPTADLMGEDVRRKCAISADVAFDAEIDPDYVPALGIVNIKKEDIERFTARGLTVKLLMRASRHADALIAYVEPQILPADRPISHTPTNHNYISLCAEHAGELAFFGQGAGRYPTAMNIIRDLLDIKHGTKQALPKAEPLKVDNTLEKHRYYIRTSADLPDGLVEKQVNGAVITGIISVEEMHSMAKALIAGDAGTFIAGIPEMEF